MNNRGTSRTRSLLIAALALICLAVLGVLAEWRIMLGSDPAWLLYISHRALEGELPYRDIFDINPPLIIWMGELAVLIAKLFHISVVDAFRAGVFLLAAGAILLGARLELTSGIRVTPRPWYWLACVLVLITTPLTAFGEREHLMLALILPYLTVSVLRANGAVLRFVPTFAVGVLAGLGIALKPQYGLIWVFSVLLSVWQTRSVTLLRRPEQWASALVLVLYPIAILLLTPDYLTVVERWGATYWAYRHADLAGTLLGRPSALAVWLTLVLYGLFWRGAGYRPLTDMLALTVLALLVGIAVQRKGFDYHFYPALGCAMLLLSVLAGPGRAETPRSWSLARRVSAIVLLATISLPLLSKAWARATVSTPSNWQRYRELEQGLGERVENAPILALSARMGSAFRLVTYGGARWTLRHPELWMLPALYREELRVPGRLRFHPFNEQTSIERSLIPTILQDVRNAPPRFVLVSFPNVDDMVNQDTRFDFLAYFMQDPEFRAFLRAYDSLPPADRYRIFRRREQ